MNQEKIGVIFGKGLSDGTAAGRGITGENTTGGGGTSMMSDDPTGLFIYADQYKDNAKHCR